MKKLITIIIILVIIFVAMFAYKNLKPKASEINVQEIEKIENYINQIYMWKEVTGEALPYFEDINQANEIWIWEVVKKNLEEYELSHSQIQEKAKELFGENFTKEFPKEGTDALIYDEENDKYYAEGLSLDQQEDVFIINTASKIENGYEIEIIEYLEDYSETTTEKSNIIIRNIDGSKIGEIDTNDEGQAKELAKSNKDKLTKKKILLKLENEKIYVEKVYQP